MASSQLIKNILERMTQLEVTQAELAEACGLSQPHVSKVLSKRVKLGRKTEHKLSTWLEATSSDQEKAREEIMRTLTVQFETLQPEKRMHFMEFLKAVERLLET